MASTGPDPAARADSAGRVKHYLVVGASGTVGSGVAKLLVDAAAKVRGSTSRKANVGTRHGIEWVHLDLAGGAGIGEALAGVDRAFLLAPPRYADQHRLLSPLVAEAKRRDLEKVVLMTAMGANAADTPFRRVEVELEQSGMPYNIIRPNWFMQNFNTFWLQGIKEQGKILLPAGRAKVSFIDGRDIAAVAANLLASDDENNRDFDLTGPAALDHDEVARIISHAAGRRIVYEDIPADAFRQGLLAAGLPADYAESLVVIMGFLKEGHAARTTGEVKRLLGREPIRFEQYARDHRDAWQRA